MGKQPGLLDAVVVSSFFAVPWMYLIGGHSPYPWFNEAQRFQKQMRLSGSYVYGHSVTNQTRFGLTLLRSGPITEMTLTAGTVAPREIGEWDRYLLEQASELRIDGRSVMYEEYPLGYSNLKVFHLITINMKNRQSKAHLYCRLFSSSTGSVTIGSQRIYDPVLHRAAVIELLSETQALTKSTV